MLFDLFNSARIYDDMGDHELQGEVERLIEELLTDEERDVFYYRFGMRMPHRAIAKELGYRSQRSIQIIEQRIIDRIGAALDTADAKSYS